MTKRKTHRHGAISPHRYMSCPLARHGGSETRARGSDRAFTLIEMTVVIAIIILLAGLVVPAATQLWRDRKIADAQNMITGMLTTARARALQSGGAETGLFFFIDEQGAQRVAPITQNPNDPAETDQTRIIKGWETDGRWYNVFTVVRDRGFTLPPPMRVVPLYAICDPQNDNSGICEPKSNAPNAPNKFSDGELKNPLSDSITISPGTYDTAQVHRNFFGLIFAPNGEMIVGRNVVIRDVDDVAEAEVKDRGKGVVTTARTQAPPTTGVTNFFLYDPPNSDQSITFASLDPQPDATRGGNDYPPTWLLTDFAGAALNFPSVDGLLVYDDSLFNEAGDAIAPSGRSAKRQFLLDYGLPFYINRLTGAVVRGPVGEGQ